MCGIFGWIPSFGQRSRDPVPTALSLEAALRHRGPDDSGFLVFPAEDLRHPVAGHDAGTGMPFGLLMGQTRLSIIDLSSAGHQPMRSADGRYTLVFNGEIYNYRELRHELEVLGRVFRTETDTEVLLQALIVWGTEALPRLKGMFAFALFDACRRSLFCARDCFGIKPFYWHSGETGFCFASEIPALLEFPGVPRRAAPAAAYQYLCYERYDVGAATMLEDIFALPPAHYMELPLDAPGSVEPRRWWKPDIADTCSLSFGDAASCLRELFLDSVRLHLRSDVPLGVALSGGIDSSAVTCAVRHLEPDTDLHTFSFIAAGTDVSEERWATLVAENMRAIRHTVTVEPAELTRDLDALIVAQGEPFASTSIYAQYRVFQLARECGITVTLDGQGADELLAGYYGYPGPRMAGLLRHGQLLRAMKNFRAHQNWPDRTAAYLLRQIAREFTPRWLTPLALRCIGRSAVPRWLDAQALRQCHIRLVREDMRKRLYASGSLLKRTLATELVWERLPHLLRHGDRNSMAHSIESRVPFLTREMAEFCMSLPEHYLVDDHGCTKSIFRHAMRGIVPDAILDRRDKIGFATPERQWLKILAPWVDATLSQAEDVPFLRLDMARREWRDILTGRRHFGWQVWRWLCYARWVQLFAVSA
ncbi:asparagine synthase (glutamine-hydrolyzing) [uncultured Desulfovibrio sp.]|uniref:asparagine synthase (glutamine-hydrolyzing) n=1 Tax=uncultured Desulfovibrio sp. TaxID=167968 RepID=UPI0025D6A07A|nr:asparagine synthase (glutamine-hydrolyzing) [uncultured Desulfovibrio sp.]